MTHSEFVSVLGNMRRLFEQSPPENPGHKKDHTELLPSRAQFIEYWLENSDDPTMKRLTGRTQAYIATYYSLFGSPLPFRGGRLDNGHYVHWDKKVIKFLLLGQYLREVHDGFVLTREGQQMLFRKEFA